MTESASRRPQLSLVICTLNEADSIGPVLDEVRGVLEGASYEIIVVDDSADDATADVVRRRAAADIRIRLVRREGVRGLASACIAGWDVARGEILGVMDGDGQHDASLIRTMLEKMRREDADLAIASRFKDDNDIGLTGFRKALSTVGVSLSRLVIGAHTTDPLTGFFLQKREWFQAARPRLSGIGFKILIDVLASGKRAPRVAEVNTALRTRIGGESKLDLRIMVELAAQLVEKRSNGILPARFVMFAGVGVSGLAVHLTTLATGHAIGLPFWASQAAAITIAMTSNYTLNNLITFRDLRRTGRDWWTGLAGFALACSGGAVIAQAVGMLLEPHAPELLAGAAGAITAALWNYWSSSRTAWGLPKKPRDVAQGDVVRGNARIAG